MAFFTQTHASIDRNLEMSDIEAKNAAIARILDSNAWKVHEDSHPGAKLSILSDEDGSHIEKTLKNKHEQGPVLKYDSNEHSVTAECCCKKEKFIFNMKDDTVESEHSMVKMKEFSPYRKKDDNGPENSYGRSQTNEDNPMYNSGVVRSSNLGYNSSSQQEMKYKN